MAEVQQCNSAFLCKAMVHLLRFSSVMSNDQLAFIIMMVSGMSVPVRVV